MAKNNKEMLTEMQERFKQINEYVINHFGPEHPSTVNEDDDTPSADDDVEETPAEGQDVTPAPETGDAEQAPEADNAEAMSDIPAEEGDMTNDAMPVDDGMTDEVEPMQSDDEVISVDELTDSQESIEYKVDGMSEKFDTVITLVKAFQKALDDNTKHVEDLKKELEKRAPTEQETIQVNTKMGAPFDKDISRYFDERMKDNPNYNVKKDDEDLNVYQRDISPSHDFEAARSIETHPNNLMDYFGF